MLTDEQRQRVAGSLGLARWVASNCGPLTEDNVATAYLALCRAATTWRPDAGMSWESYARQRVRGDLLDVWKLAGGYRRKPRPGELDVYTEQSGEWRITRGKNLTRGQPDHRIEAIEDRDEARYLFAAFDDRAQHFVRRWCAGETKADIATAEGISERRVGQVINARVRQLAAMCD